MTSKVWIVLSVIVLVFAAAFAVACDGGDGGGDANGSGAATQPAGDEGEKLRVVSTVSPITSIVENIGGTRIELEGIVPEGVNSHTFEPAPSVAGLLAEADLIVVNGLDLEEPTLEMAAANKQADAVILLLGDNTITEAEHQYDFSFPESEGHPNPHLWPNPMHALRYAELVHEQLVQLDPENADYYDENLEAFRARIEELDQRIRDVIATIPEENRKLLTYHDSWAYFAPVYGMEVIGAVQPSDFSEPSASEVASLIDQIREEGVPAVFGSEVFPSDVLETIASEAGAQYIDELADDDLPGAPGDPGHTYFGLMKRNIEIMANGLGGDPAAIADFDTSLVFTDGESGAVYPQ